MTGVSIGKHSLAPVGDAGSFLKIAIALFSRKLKSVNEKTENSLKLCQAASFIFDKNTSSRDNKIASCNDGAIAN